MEARELAAREEEFSLQAGPIQASKRKAVWALLSGREEEVDWAVLEERYNTPESTYSIRSTLPISGTRRKSPRWLVGHKKNRNRKHIEIGRAHV